MNDFEVVRWWLPDFPDGYSFDAQEEHDPFAALERIEADYGRALDTAIEIGAERDRIEAENERLQAAARRPLDVAQEGLA